MGNTVMVYGIGEVGGETLEILGRTEGIERIVACDINEEWGEFRTNMAATGCIFQGFLKKWEFRQSDVTDIDATARLLEEVKPDAILTGLTIRGPRVLKTAPIPCPGFRKDRLKRGSRWLYQRSQCCRLSEKRGFL